MNIQPYLTKRRRIIDRALEQTLNTFQRYPKNLYKAMRYSVFSGGKRFRPILAMASGELYGASRRALLPFACAIELIHTYSLIHDDLPALDDDDIRRGKPSCHKVFGEGIAMLAGDALLTEAFALMSRNPTKRGPSAALVLQLIYEVAYASGTRGMVGGQSIDLEAEGRPVNVAGVERIHRYKTGALILASARLGAIMGGAGAADLRRISRYGESLGLAFQITDDLLDVESPSVKRSGGSPRSREELKKTYPSVAGIAYAKARVAQLQKKCLKELEPYGKKADSLRAIACFVMDRTG